MNDEEANPVPTHRIAAFWNNVAKLGDDDCWLWRGGFMTNPRGMRYGTFRLNGRMDRAHRAAWVIANGASIPKGLVVRHKCDVTLCCNPRHLEIGTQADNVADCQRRGRGVQPSGERNGKSRLKAADIPKIRQLISQGVTRTAIAEMFGVTRRAVYSVDRGETWRGEVAQ